MYSTVKGLIQHRTRHIKPMPILIIAKGVQVESETLPNNWNVGPRHSTIAKGQYHRSAEMKLYHGCYTSGS
jgi:hypothetical protein